MSAAEDIDLDDLDLSDDDRDALGDPVSVHKAASRMHRVNIVIAGVFTAAMFIPAVGCLILHFVGPPKNQIWIGAAIFGGIGLLPAVGLFFLLRRQFMEGASFTGTGVQ